jgi:hypothetical protein
MRMKCQFCNASCFLVREGDPDFYGSSMLWECRNHPSVQHVRHCVLFNRQYSRGKKSRQGKNRQGIIREWTYTEVRWTNSNGLIYCARWHYNEDENPQFFKVTTEDPNWMAPKNPADWTDHFAEKEALVLEEFPAGITPENVKSKISTWILFS